MSGDGSYEYFVSFFYCAAYPVYDHTYRQETTCSLRNTLNPTRLHRDEEDLLHYRFPKIYNFGAASTSDLRLYFRQSFFPALVLALNKAALEFLFSVLTLYLP